MPQQANSARFVNPVPVAAAVCILLPFAAYSQSASPQKTERPQRESLPADLPQGPAKPGFEPSRFSNAGNGWFKTFYVTETQPLQNALNGGKVAADTRVLVLATAGGKLALLTDQMSYHHIAEGTAGRKTWMATF